MRQEVKEITEAIHHLYYQVERANDNAKHEQEKTLLMMENALLKFERRLPPAAKTEDD